MYVKHVKHSTFTSKICLAASCKQLYHIKLLQWPSKSEFNDRSKVLTMVLDYITHFIAKVAIVMIVFELYNFCADSFEETLSFIEKAFIEKLSAKCCNEFSMPISLNFLPFNKLLNGKWALFDLKKKLVLSCLEILNEISHQKTIGFPLHSGQGIRREQRHKLSCDLLLSNWWLYSPFCQIENEIYQSQ